MSLIIDDALEIPKERAKIIRENYLFLKEEIKKRRIETPAEAIKAITTLPLNSLEAIRLAYSLGSAEGSGEIWR